MPSFRVHHALFAAPGPRDAWVFAGGAYDSLLVWNLRGGKWQSEPVPSALAGYPINVYAAAGSAADNVWLVGYPASTNPEPPEYASRWTGRGWKQYELRGITNVGSVVTLSPSSTWVLGQKPGETTVDGGAVAQRLSGRAPKTVPMPGWAFSASAPSAKAIWALGLTGPDNKLIFMHWRGKSWSILQPARFKLPDGQAPEAMNFTALSATDLWAIAGPRIDPCGCVTTPPGLLLEHWNGHRWSETKLLGGTDFAGPVSDGAGGIWFATLRGKKEYFMHLHDGKLTGVPVPRVHGVQPWPLALQAIPHSRSVWAVGTNFLLSYNP